MAYVKQLAWTERVVLKSGPALAVRFKNGETLYLAYVINDRLLIVSTSGKLDWHICANGSLAVSPTPRVSAAPKQEAKDG